MDEADATAIEAIPEAIPQAAPPPRAERQSAIAGLASGKTPSHFVPYRGGFLQAPVIEVPQEQLVYRVENGRLIAELEEYALGRHKDLATLAAGQETLGVQRLLHAFLVDKAVDPDGPILQELSRLAQQTEPLLITADGVMVNGNRRLASMRELFRQDPERYAGFARISVAVLPADAEAADVESVEASLQLAPETKLGYGWINRRLKMRRQRDQIGVPIEVLLEAYRMDDPVQFDRQLEELALVEAYLADFLGEPGRYSKAVDTEALFVGLRERLAVLQEPLRRIWRLAGFAMIHGRGAVGGPMDRHFPFTEPQPGQLPVWALRRFAEDRELIGSDPESHDAALPADVLESLAVILSDHNNSDVLAAELFAAMEMVRVDFQELGSPKRLFKMVEKLRQSIGHVEPGRLSDKQRLQLRSELAAIQAQAAVLLGDAPAPSHRATGLGDRLAGMLRRT